MSVLDGRYLFGDMLGEGAYGVVCRAVDLKSAVRALVAVKTVDLELLPPARRAYAVDAIEREVCGRWRAAAVSTCEPSRVSLHKCNDPSENGHCRPTLQVKLLRSIEHPNVLRAIDFISDSTRLHIVLELLEGPDLQAVLDSRGALRTSEVKSILLQVCAADHRPPLVTS